MVEDLARLAMRAKALVTWCLAGLADAGKRVGAVLVTSACVLRPWAAKLADSIDGQLVLADTGWLMALHDTLLLFGTGMAQARVNA